MDEKKDRPVIHVRVMASKVVVEDVASQISELLASQGYEVIEQTALNPDRYDPEQGKVFLTVR
jgi:uncharacterized protein YfdQ (DUF2303 family)